MLNLSQFLSFQIFAFLLTMAVANGGVIHAPFFGRFSVEKQESLLKITILSIAAVLAFSTRLFSVLRLVFDALSITLQSKY